MATLTASAGTFMYLADGGLGLGACLIMALLFRPWSDGCKRAAAIVSGRLSEAPAPRRS
jgi:hypothetical protein